MRACKSWRGVPMFIKSNELSSLFTPLRGKADRPRVVEDQTPGTRQAKLKGQRKKLQECLEALERVNEERHQLREQLDNVTDFADRALNKAEEAQGRALTLEAEVDAKA